MPYVWSMKMCRAMARSRGRWTTSSAISTPAPFGQRGQTLLDTNVCDAGEIAADRLTLQWQPNARQALQAEVAWALGLPAIGMASHNLQVYARSEERRVGKAWRW